MSSGLINKLRRNIGLRLSLWYVLLFSVSCAVLFTLTYYLLSAAAEDRDREVIDARLKEAVVIFENSGVRGLQDWVQYQSPKLQKLLFVSVENLSGSVTFVNVPEEWVNFSAKPDEWEDRRDRQGGLLRIPRDEENELLLKSVLLPDGTTLTIGRSTYTREVLLKLLRHSFLLVGSVTVILGFFAGNLFAYRAMRPIRQIVADAIPASAGPRLERLSLAEVALITDPRPRWRSQTAPQLAIGAPPRFVPLAELQHGYGVRLLNAARHEGLAARTRVALNQRGWKSVTIGDSARVRQHSLVLYSEANEQAARRLATHFGFWIAREARPGPLTVLLGRDWVKRSQARA